MDQSTSLSCQMQCTSQRHLAFSSVQVSLSVMELYKMALVRQFVSENQGLFWVAIQQLTTFFVIKVPKVTTSSSLTSSSAFPTPLIKRQPKVDYAMKHCRLLSKRPVDVTKGLGINF